jgi:hypothetical protein
MKIMGTMTATRAASSTRALASLINILEHEITTREAGAGVDRRSLALLREAHRALTATWGIYSPTETPRAFAAAFDQALASRTTFARRRTEGLITKHMDALLSDIGGALQAFITPNMHVAHLMQPALVAA